MCAKRKPKSLRTLLVLDELEDVEGKKRKMKMQARHKGHQNCDLYDLRANRSDEASFEDPKDMLHYTITSTIMKSDSDVKKISDNISNLILMFNFFTFLILHRRRNEKSLNTYFLMTNYFERSN